MQVMMAPDSNQDTERSEMIMTFSKPQTMSKPMFMEDAEETIRFQVRSIKDNEEVKQYTREEFKEEMDDDGNIIDSRPAERHVTFEQSQENDEPEIIQHEIHNPEPIQDHGGNNMETSDDDDPYNEAINQEEHEHDRQVDMAMEDRINRYRVLSIRSNQENSIHEVQSSIGNISQHIPNIAAFHESALMRNSSQEASDDEELESMLIDYSKSLEERIDAVKNEFISTVISTKRQILFTKRDLKRQIREYEKKAKEEYERIRVKNEMLQENKRKLLKMQSDNEDIIDLDIGGTHQITTTRATLCRFKNSGLAAMFSGKFPLKCNGDRVFMDRDGEPFCKLVSYLRTGNLPTIPDKQQYHLFKNEMEYWQIPFDVNEEEKLQELPYAVKFDSSWCAPTLELDASHKIVKKNIPNHGIVFCSHPFDEEYNYQEFKVVITEPSRTKSHLFIGVVDKSKYRNEFLTSTFWRDSP